MIFCFLALTCRRSQIIDDEGTPLKLKQVTASRGRCVDLVTVPVGMQFRQSQVD